MWMDDLFSGSAGIFGLPAVLGTGFFILRTVLSFAGAAGHDVDHHADGSLDVHPDAAHPDAAHPDDHHDPAAHPLAHSGLLGISWAEAFSLQSISAFATGFGWAGLIALHVLKLPLILDLPIATASGLALAYAVIRIFRSLRRLESDGTIPKHSLIGLEGDVYIGIPERGKGSGQVRVVIGSVAKMIHAVSRDTPIPTGSRVLILDQQPDNALLVQAVSPP